MAQDLVAKRRAIGANAASRATDLWNAVIFLQELTLEAQQSQNFEDSDFDAGNSPQLTGFMVGLFLSTVAPAIQTFLETPLEGSGIVPRDILLQMRP